MEPKLGAPQTCPVCGGSNPSGLSLPKQCVWCKKKITMSRENIDVVINDLEENIAWLKKEAELHELAMQQNKDRMQDLEDENATLRQQNAELVEALERVKRESGTHTIAVGQKTGFALIYDIAKAVLTRHIDRKE